MHSAPNGTLTFLFTDIEGSTRRWEHSPQAMAAAVARHDAIMRDAVAQHDGYIFKTGGDAFFVAFETATQALHAALAAQLALQGEPWADELALRVRMALHTGAAEARDGDYFGLPLNRTARLLGAAHGAQVLISLATQQLVRDLLPPETGLRDLGEVWLRDLLRPERIFQLVHPALPVDFAPLRGVAQPPDASVPADAPGTIANPYKGLRAFAESDAPDFFGREALTARLAARLTEPSQLGRFLAVIGPSGSGKSSVVRAGLLPALRGDAARGSGHWLVAQMVPGPQPFEELEAALLRAAPNPPASVLEQLQADERGLVRAVKRLLPVDGGTELVLLVDQFEEVFTLVADERTRLRFLTSLCIAVSDPRSRLRVVVTLRADFYDRPLLYPDPGELIRQRTEVVLPLSADEVYRAITGPARRVGVAVEPELMTALLQEVTEQPGALPLLQYALTELFEHRDGRTLTLAAYQARGGLLGALSRRAEELYGALSSAEQELTRQLFLRLITLGEGSEDTRRRARVAEISSLAPDDAMLDGIMEHFGSYRLLTFDRDPLTGDRTVEVAHEALIRVWDRLREWLAESRDELRLQRRLAEAAAEWAGNSRDPSYLASGTRLAQFVAIEAAGHISLNAAERDYLRESVAARDALVAAEQTRQQRELAAAQQLAAIEKRRADEQRRTSRSLRRRAILLAGALILALVAAGGSGVLAQRNGVLATQNAAVAQTAEAAGQAAQQNLQNAESQRFAAEANAVLERNGSGELAALLAMRGLAAHYTPQAEAALRRAAHIQYGERIFQHPDQITSAALSADNHRLLTGAFDGVVRLWDAESGALLREFHGHAATMVGAVALSPDGRYALSGSADTTARLWDVESGKQLREFKNKFEIAWVTFSADGSSFWIGGRGNDSRKLDLKSGRVQRVLPPGNYGLALSTHEDLLATSQGNGVRIWEVSSGRLRLTLDLPTEATNVAFSPDDRTILTSRHWTSTAELWDAATGAQLRTLASHTEGIMFGAFSPDGRLAVTASMDGTAHLTDVSSGALVRQLRGHTAVVYVARFSQDGSLIVTASADHTARLWESASPAEFDAVAAHTAGVNLIRFSADGSTMLTGADDQRAVLSDAAARRPTKTLEFLGLVQNGDLTLDGRQALVYTNDGTQWYYDRRADTSPVISVVGSTRTAVFSADGRFVLADNTRAVNLYEAATGRLIRSLVRPDTGQLFATGFSADRRFAVLRTNGPAGAQMVLWDLETGQRLRAFEEVGEENRINFSPDGRLLAAVRPGDEVRIWDVASGHLMHTLSGHTSPVMNIDFSADGRYLVSASQDKTALVWDPNTGAQVAILPAHGNTTLMTAAFTPDSRTVALGSTDGYVQFEPVALAELIKAVCGRVLRDFTPEERAIYGIADASPTCAPH